VAVFGGACFGFVKFYRMYELGDRVVKLLGEFGERLSTVLGTWAEAQEKAKGIGYDGLVCAVCLAYVMWQVVRGRAAETTGESILEVVITTRQAPAPTEEHGRATGEAGTALRTTLFWTCGGGWTSTRE